MRGHLSSSGSRARKLFSTAAFRPRHVLPLYARHDPADLPPRCLPPRRAPAHCCAFVLVIVDEQRERLDAGKHRELRDAGGRDHRQAGRNQAAVLAWLNGGR